MHGGGGQETGELVLGNGSFSEVVEVEDELFESDLFHDNLSLYFLLYLVDVKASVRNGLHRAGLFEVRVGLGSSHLEVLMSVVDGITELHIVNFPLVVTVII